MAAGSALTLAGCNSVGVDLPSDSGQAGPVGPARGRPAGRRDAGHRPGSGRNDPAADPKWRRPEPDRRLDAQCGAAGDRRFWRSLHHADDRGRPFERRRRGAGGSIGTRRRGATHPRAGVRQRRAVGVGGGEVGGPADDRLLDRRHRRGAGRLSPVLPHPGLCRQDPSIRRLDRQEVVRDHGAAERLRQCRRRAVPGHGAETSTRKWW